MARWLAEQHDGICYVTGEIDPQAPAVKRVTDAAAHLGAINSPASVAIVGAGAAGNAAAEMLRREGHAGPLTLIGSGDTVPYDRPNLSKDYLASTASEEWMPLRPAAFYEEQRIRLILGRRVVAVDVPRRHVVLDDATSHEFGALLLATGAEPVRLPTSVGSGVRYLRTLVGSRAIIAAATDGRDRSSLEAESAMEREARDSLTAATVR